MGATCRTRHSFRATKNRRKGCFGKIVRVEHHGGYEVLEPPQAHSLEILIGEVDLEIAVQSPQEADQSISIHLENIGEELFNLT